MLLTLMRISETRHAAVCILLFCGPLTVTICPIFDGVALSTKTAFVEEMQSFSWDTDD